MEKGAKMSIFYMWNLLWKRWRTCFTFDVYYENKALNKLLKAYNFIKLEILSLKLFKTDFSIDNLGAVVTVVDLKNDVLESMLHLSHSRFHIWGLLDLTT